MTAKDSAGVTTEEDVKEVVKGRYDAPIGVAEREQFAAPVKPPPV